MVCPKSKTDNWGNTFNLGTWTVVADDANPHMLSFDIEKSLFTDGFESGDTSAWSLSVVDRQGVGVSNGTPMSLSNSGGVLSVQASGGGLPSMQAVLTSTTRDGLITGTITSAISQTVIITAETTSGLVETVGVSFFQAYHLFLPVLLRN